MTKRRRERECETEENFLSGEERFRLERLIASYGGEESIVSRRDVLPPEVVQAVETIGTYDNNRGLVNLHNNDNIIKDINSHCFALIQQITMENSTRLTSSFGASVVRQCGKSTLECTPPTWMGSTGAFTQKWIGLLKKVSLLLKKRDKALCKQCPCECKTSTPHVFEFSLACTPCDRGIDGVQRIVNNWYVDYGYDDDDNQQYKGEGGGAATTMTATLRQKRWQIYDNCTGNFGVILERCLKTRGRLIKMLREEDEDVVSGKLQLNLLLQPSSGDQPNFHTLEHIDADITLPSPSLFCYRGTQKDCPCQPYSKAITFVKRRPTIDSTPKNSLILTQWPFEHDTQDQFVECGNDVLVDNLPTDDRSSCTSCIDVRSFVHQSCLIQRVSCNDVNQSR